MWFFPHRSLFPLMVVLAILEGGFNLAAAREGDCSVLLLRWASAETMPDFWREIKADRVLAERPAQKFLTWVMASALRIDQEKVAAEWEKTVQEEFIHTWHQRSWPEDFRFYHLMGEIIYGIKGQVDDALLPLVLDLQQAHAWGLLKGAQVALHNLGLEREQYLANQQVMSVTEKQAYFKGATLIRANFNQAIQEVFQAFNSLIPNNALQLRTGDTTLQEIQEEVIRLQLKWETEEMIFQVLEAKLQKT